MKSPVVSFVIPCYKLAHLLPECVNSILAQTYPDIEVLIMDDCSPDNTPEVARSFKDPRVRHIRNDPNLGHLANYNKGIKLARGKYVWLVSADDFMGQPYVVQRYVELLEEHPEVGYAFCPGVVTGSAPHTDMQQWVLRGQAVFGSQDRIIPGQRLVESLLGGNAIVAASGLVRRECYEKVTYFPLNMPWAGDWYLWCAFALFYDVAYFAEPMVCYREHDLSMTASVMQQRLEACAAEEIEILWSLHGIAAKRGFSDLAEKSLGAIADHYFQSLSGRRGKPPKPCLTLEQFEQSVRRSAPGVVERKRVCSQVWARMADHCYSQTDLVSARQLYAQALGADPWMLRTWVKRLLLASGPLGKVVRRGLKGVSGPAPDTKP